VGQQLWMEKAGPVDFGASQKSILCVSNTFCINSLYIDIGSRAGINFIIVSLVL